MVVAAIGGHTRGPLARPAHFAAYRRGTVRLPQGAGGGGRRGRGARRGPPTTPPSAAARPGSRGRPVYGSRRSPRGSSGSIRDHNSSDTIHGATAIGTPPSLTTGTDGVRRQ